MIRMILTVVLFSAVSAAAESERLFVRHGTLVSGHTISLGGEVYQRDGNVEIAGPDTHLMTDVGLGPGDARVTAELSIHGLAGSAAAFKMDRTSSFGFEGNHRQMYINGPVFNDVARPIGKPAEFLADGKRFRFEVIRCGDTLRFEIDGRQAHETRYPADYPLGSLSFTGRRATVRLYAFSVTGNLQPLENLTAITLAGIHLHPTAKYRPDLPMGPFVRAGDGRIISVHNDQVLCSTDEGMTWSGQNPFPEDEKFAFSGERGLIRTHEGVIIGVFMNQALRVWGWNSAEGLPEENARSDVWSIRSPDDGRTWERPVLLYDDSYCGCIRGLLETSGGNIIATVQGFVPRLHRHATFPYVSTDQGRTWKRTGQMLDLPGYGHHDGAIEGTLVELRDQRIHLLLRNGAYDELASSYSRDFGLTWTEPVPSGIDASDGPALVFRLADGRLALLWNRLYPEGQTEFLRGGGNDRTKRLVSLHREALSLSLSPDDGQTWTKPVVIAKKHLSSGRARVAYPYGFESLPGTLWITTMQGDLRMELDLDRVVDSTTHRPMKEWPW